MNILIKKENQNLKLYYKIKDRKRVIFHTLINITNKGSLTLVDAKSSYLQYQIEVNNDKGWLLFQD